MKIGVIVFSRGGHTLAVATKLAEKLSAAGHVVRLEQLKAIGRSMPGTKQVQLETLPDPGAYDALVIGAATEGGMPSAPMTSYLNQIASLKNKRVALLVNQGFPFPSWGGNQTVAGMKGLVEAKGGTVVASGIANLMNLHRNRQIAGVVERLSSAFGTA